MPMPGTNHSAEERELRLADPATPAAVAVHAGHRPAGVIAASAVPKPVAALMIPFLMDLPRHPKLVPPFPSAAVTSAALSWLGPAP